MSRVAGSAQSGTYELSIAVEPNSALVLTVTVRDLFSGNTTTQTVTVDNDGIASAVDRARKRVRCLAGDRLYVRVQHQP